MSEYAVVMPPHMEMWAMGFDQPQFFTEVESGAQGMTGPMGMVTDDKPFRGRKRWEGQSKSGVTCVVELVKRDGDIVRCNERREQSKWSCCVVAGHDGPHIPITDELEHASPEGEMYVITEMRRQSSRPGPMVTPACAAGEHEVCQCLQPGQNPAFAGKVVYQDTLTGEFEIIGDCECWCHG